MEDLFVAPRLSWQGDAPAPPRGPSARLHTCCASCFLFGDGSPGVIVMSGPTKILGKSWYRGAMGARIGAVGARIGAVGARIGAVGARIGAVGAIFGRAVLDQYKDVR